MSDPEERSGRDRLLKLIISLIAIVLLVIFWAQNRDRVKVTFWIADANVRLWIALGGRQRCWIRRGLLRTQPTELNSTARDLHARRAFGTLKWPYAKLSV